MWVKTKLQFKEFEKHLLSFCNSTILIPQRLNLYLEAINIRRFQFAKKLRNKISFFSSFIPLRVKIYKLARFRSTNPLDIFIRF